MKRYGPRRKRWRSCLVLTSLALADILATYNLDMIIAVGYRVSSARATKFRTTQRIDSDFDKQVRGLFDET